MKVSTTKVLSAAGAAALLVPGLAIAASPAADTPATWTTVPASSQAVEGEAPANGVVRVPNVQGEFSFDQTTVTPNNRIADVFQKASATLCGASTELAVTQADDWSIAVGGDVANPYNATIGEIAQDDGTLSQIMGCSCAANPAGGRAVVNANVSGVSLAALIERARPAANANTVTLTSADGYTMSLPLDYVMQRRAIIASAINGEDLGASVGGTNQVWLDGTAAKYFTRNVVSIEVTAEAVAPAIPGSEDAPEDQYVNRPTVGILAGA